MKKLKKLILIIFGSIFLTLGVIGLFLPILPTTPFLLLSASCFLRSSKTAYRWIMTNKVLGRYIFQYKIVKALPLKTKITAFLGLWITMLLSILIVPIIWVKVLLLIIATGVTVHIAMIKTMGAKERVLFESEYKRFLCSKEFLMDKDDV